ncbi:S8 family serine peptidase [Streptomyces sp. NPDC002659]|uniref:S8 family serine peptidase n=1 Tax=Streptomyces sp. NPDC002659 TaxID=3364656 RepID=UPI0036C1D026
MTAGMGQARKRNEPRTLRRGVLCTLVAVGMWTVASAGMAPAAVAADAQSKQWYLKAMGAEDIWKSTTGEGISVAVIDTGVNASTSSLKGQVLKGLDATDAAGEATDDYTGHGTTMAELIAGTGQGGGLRGLAPGAKIIPMRIATESFKADKVNEWSDSAAIRAAADSDARIISMSFGSEFMTARDKEAVKYAQSKGKLLFAPVGNSAKKGNKAEYPASYPEVVGVAAIGSEGRVADYSQHGDFVDIAAPGNDIPRWCNAKFESYCDGNGGTSAATAIASASAALIWSAHPEWTANQVLRVMFESAVAPEGSRKGTLSNYLGHGVVRPGAHINRGLGKPGDPNLSPLTNKKTSGSTASPTPSAPASSQAAKDKSGDDAAVAGSSKSTDDGGQLGLIIGIGAAVVIAVGAFAVIRKRRST